MDPTAQSQVPPIPPVLLDLRREALIFSSFPTLQVRLEKVFKTANHTISKSLRGKTTPEDQHGLRRWRQELVRFQKVKQASLMQAFQGALKDRISKLNLLQWPPLQQYSPFDTNESQKLERKLAKQRAALFAELWPKLFHFKPSVRFYRLLVAAMDFPHFQNTQRENPSTPRDWAKLWEEQSSDLLAKERWRKMISVTRAVLAHEMRQIRSGAHMQQHLAQRSEKEVEDEKKEIDLALGKFVDYVERIITLHDQATATGSFELLKEREEACIEGELCQTLLNVAGEHFVDCVPKPEFIHLLNEKGLLWDPPESQWPSPDSEATQHLTNCWLRDLRKLAKQRIFRMFCLRLDTDIFNYMGASFGRLLANTDPQFGDIQRFFPARPGQRSNPFNLNHISPFTPSPEPEPSQVAEMDEAMTDSETPTNSTTGSGRESQASARSATGPAGGGSTEAATPLAHPPEAAQPPDALPDPKPWLEIDEQVLREMAQDAVEGLKEFENGHASPPVQDEETRRKWKRSVTSTPPPAFASQESAEEDFKFTANDLFCQPGMVTSMHNDAVSHSPIDWGQLDKDLEEYDETYHGGSAA